MPASSASFEAPWHRGTHPSPAAKQFARELQIPVTILGIEVRPGDGVFADDDGIVVIPMRQVGQAVVAASAVDLRERGIAARLEAGETTMRVLGLET
jgi:4-hydroxy-4-methyl-2-oxoglutarate aldolase